MSKPLLNMQMATLNIAQCRFHIQARDAVREINQKLIPFFYHKITQLFYKISIVRYAAELLQFVNSVMIDCL